jgi:hypothetical protein
MKTMGGTSINIDQNKLYQSVREKPISICKLMCLVITGFVLSLMQGCSDSKDWEFTVPGEREQIGQPARIGLNLVTTICVRLELPGPEIAATPANITITPDDTDAVIFEIGKRKCCSGNMKSNALELKVKPTREGPNRLRFLADNTDDVGIFKYNAVPPGAMSSDIICNSRTFPENDFRYLHNASLKMFCGSSIRIIHRFYDSWKDILGQNAFDLNMPQNSGTFMSCDTLIFGPEPHSISLTNMFDTRFDIDVVDENSIDTIEVYDIISEQYGDTIKLSSLYSIRINLRPYDKSGIPIWGTPHPPCSLEVAGDVVKATSPDLTRNGYAESEHFTIQPLKPGSVNALFKWGPARKSIVITVVDSASNSRVYGK